jgi:hypothetical protein
MEIPMWKALIAGTTMLTIAGSTLASAQQPSSAERSHHAQLTTDDIAAFTDARIAAIKTALKLTPAQEKNWPAVEQTLRDISKERVAQREARAAAGQRTDATERWRRRCGAWPTPRSRCTRASTRRRSAVSAWQCASRSVGTGRRLTRTAEARPDTLAERCLASSPRDSLGAGWIHGVSLGKTSRIKIGRRTNTCIGHAGSGYWPAASDL